MKPTHFNVDRALEFLSDMVSSDEVLKALDIIDNSFPIYYLENPTESMLRWKENVYKKIATIQDYYKGETHDINIEKILKEYETVPRYKMIEQFVSHINSQGRVAYICELGPGQCWLAIGLKEKGFKFKYHPITITGELFAQARDYLGDIIVNKPEFNQPQIFVCMEVVEHLPFLGDVFNYYCRENLNAEYVVVSTPNGCLGGGWKRDNAEMVVHLRTFSQRTLLKFCHQYWPRMNWGLADMGEHQLMAIGQRVNA